MNWLRIGLRCPLVRKRKWYLGADLKILGAGKSKRRQLFGLATTKECEKTRPQDPIEAYAEKYLRNNFRPVAIQILKAHDLDYLITQGCR